MAKKDYTHCKKASQCNPIQAIIELQKDYVRQMKEERKVLDRTMVGESYSYTEGRWAMLREVAKDLIDVVAMAFPELAEHFADVPEV